MLSTEPPTLEQFTRAQPCGILQHLGQGNVKSARQGGQDHRKEVKKGSLRGLISKHPLVGVEGRRWGQSVPSAFVTALVLCTGHLNLHVWSGPELRLTEDTSSPGLFCAGLPSRSAAERPAARELSVL